jgi:hypothetical protein
LGNDVIVSVNDAAAKIWLPRKHGYYRSTENTFASKMNYDLLGMVHEFTGDELLRGGLFSAKNAFDATSIPRTN